jgi:hypothetical protein
VGPSNIAQHLKSVIEKTWKRVFKHQSNVEITAYGEQETQKERNKINGYEMVRRKKCSQRKDDKMMSHWTSKGGLHNLWVSTK